MKRERDVLPRAYPTDKLGEPVHPYELGFSAPHEFAEAPRNNHHHAFYARTFGLTAIGLAYRNLEVLQSPMIITQHTALHQRYYGMSLPSQAVMLDRIQEEQDEGTGFKIWHPDDHIYFRKPITDEKIEELKALYGK